MTEKIIVKPESMENGYIISIRIGEVVMNISPVPFEEYNQIEPLAVDLGVKMMARDSIKTMLGNAESIYQKALSVFEESVGAVEVVSPDEGVELLLEITPDDIEEQPQTVKQWVEITKDYILQAIENDKRYYSLDDIRSLLCDAFDVPANMLDTVSATVRDEIFPYINKPSLDTDTPNNAPVEKESVIEPVDVVSATDGILDEVGTSDNAPVEKEPLIEPVDVVSAVNGGTEGSGDEPAPVFNENEEQTPKMPESVEEWVETVRCDFIQEIKSSNKVYTIEMMDKLLEGYSVPAKMVPVVRQGVIAYGIEMKMLQNKGSVGIVGSIVNGLKKLKGVK